MKVYPEKYIGLTETMHSGITVTIIAYRRCDDIDVQLTDGTVLTHLDIKAFRRKQISLPRNIAAQYVGKTAIMNCGLQATIIAYRKYKDIDVQFEDNTVRKHVSIRAFEDSEIAPEPNMSTDDNKQKYIGMTRRMKCGVKATIIAYRKYNDIDVKFENGEIREHAWLHYFKSGSLAPDHFTLLQSSEKYLGQTNLMNCGLHATITAYRSHSDIDVQFEDNTSFQHTSISNFKKGGITAPTLRSAARVTGTLFDTYEIYDKAFVFHDTVYFYVSYIIDNVTMQDIMCIADMKNKLPELAKQK